MIDIEKRADGVAILRMNTPGSQNALNGAFNQAFAEAIEALLADEAVLGMVITSAKDGFAAGGDLDQLLAADTPQKIHAIVDPFLAALRRIETGGKPVAAALNGTALGGGYELALATHRRFAADRPDARFGLPEAGLGLMPGGGGTQRLPRLIGLEAAADLIIKAKALDPQTALKAGLVDELIAPGDLIETAAAWVRDNPEAKQPWDVKGFALPGTDPQTTRGRMFFAGQWVGARSRAGEHDDAAAEILHVLHHGAQRTLDAGLAIERRRFGILASSPYARNKVRTLFLGPKACRPYPASGAGENIRTLGVIGGGTMGNGIAFAAASSGLDVRLIDMDEERAAASLKRIEAIAERQVKRGRMAAQESEALLARITASADYEALRDADIVIEAVFEQIEVKHDVYRRLQDVLRPDVTIASNTSSILIRRLAEPLADRSRMVGMHFFAPVETMKLLEIIVTPETSERARDEAHYLAKRLRKTQITVKDSPGFYTSRLVSSLSSEAMTMLAEGVPPQIMDNAMTGAGFAIGPVTLAELTKLPLLHDIMISMSGEGAPRSMLESRAVEALEKLTNAGRTGRAEGKGIYDYDEDGPRLWPGLAELFPPREPALDIDTVRRRLLNTQSLEAIRALEEGVIADPLAADLAAVMGWGYPAHLGGPLGYVDTIGAVAFVEECEQLAQEFGERFAAPETLVRMAREGRAFYPTTA